MIKRINNIYIFTYIYNTNSKFGTYLMRYDDVNPIPGRFSLQRQLLVSGYLQQQPQGHLIDKIGQIEYTLLEEEEQNRTKISLSLSRVFVLTLGIAEGHALIYSGLNGFVHWLVSRTVDFAIEREKSI